MQERTFDKRIKEFCGLFGIYGHKNSGWLTYLGLYALQHRGQESCGIVSNDKGKFHVHKNMGLVNEVFDSSSLSSLKGNMAIGHVRYSTTGKSNLKNAQPLVISFSAGSIAIGHNGNLVNSKTLRQSLERSGSIFQTSTDSEIILHLMARSRKHNVIQSLIYALSRIKGSYSLVLMTKDKIIGVRDPLGWRPLCLGKLNKSWCFSSESCALDLIKAKFVREVEPGEIVVIDKNRVRSIKPSCMHSRKKAFCMFENVYFSRPDSVYSGNTVHLIRQSFGERLAVEHPVKDADYVIPVPDSGTSAALGFSHASGVPLEMGVIRNHYVGRTFIEPSQDIRDMRVRVKFNLLSQVIKGKKVVIVDDSIVRGTTSRIRMRELRSAGAKEIHLRISCPPHKFPCYYGIDFPNPKELIANRHTIEGIRRYLGVDSLGYLSLEGMLSCVKNPGDFCIACWSGEYPLKCRDKGKHCLETG